VLFVCISFEILIDLMYQLTQYVIFSYLYTSHGTRFLAWLPDSIAKKAGGRRVGAPVPHKNNDNSATVQSTVVAAVDGSQSVQDLVSADEAPAMVVPTGATNDNSNKATASTYAPPPAQAPPRNPGNSQNRSRNRNQPQNRAQSHQ
jgi:hypothetical protein